MALAALAELRLVIRVPELVVHRLERVQEQGQPVAPRLLLGDVDRVGLEAPEVLAGAAGGVAAGDVVVDTLAVREAAREDPVHRPGDRHSAGLAVHRVADPAPQLAEIDVGHELADVSVGEGVGLVALTPPRGVVDRRGDVLEVRPRLGEAKREVEDRRRVDERAGAARLRCREARAGGLVGACFGVPEAHPGPEGHLPAPGVPGRLRDADVELVAAHAHPNLRLRARERLAIGVQSLCLIAVDEQEPVGRGGDARAAWPLGRLAVADRDRRRDQVGVLERVQGHAERCRATQRLHPELDQVGGVLRVRAGRSGRCRCRSGARTRRRRADAASSDRGVPGRPSRRRGSPGRGTRRGGKPTPRDQDRRRARQGPAFRSCGAGGRGFA